MRATRWCKGNPTEGLSKGRKWVTTSVSTLSFVRGRGNGTDRSIALARDGLSKGRKWVTTSVSSLSFVRGRGTGTEFRLP